MTGASPRPRRVVHAAAPIRICDNGGWTDTWFAGHGKVFNIGVSPCVMARIDVFPNDTRPDRVVLDVENYGERFAFAPGLLPGRHPLLEAAVDHIGLPDDVSVEINICSDAPAGASTGTSAAAAVALLGALDALTPGRMSRSDIAAAARHVEVERLGLQSGIQDQLCAAYGRINYIEMFDYPHAAVSQLPVSRVTWRELDRRLVLCFLGRAHVSSDVHDRVIATLERQGGRAAVLETLRRAAEQARDAVCAADLAALGRAMTANTEAQRELHPDLVGAEAQTAIDIATAHGALGWKVNGAGGEGGSVTFLCGPDPRDKRELLRALRDADPAFRHVPTRLSRSGLRVWVTR